MRVLCDVEEVTLEGDHGGEIPSVEVTCGRCGHTEESFGTSDGSVRRCFALLRENCPNRENNFYTDED